MKNMFFWILLALTIGCLGVGYNLFINEEPVGGLCFCLFSAGTYIGSLFMWWE